MPQSERKRNIRKKRPVGEQEPAVPVEIRTVRRRGVAIFVSPFPGEIDTASGLPLVTFDEAERRLREVEMLSRQMHAADPAKSVGQIAAELTEQLGRSISTSAVARLMQPKEARPKVNLVTRRTTSKPAEPTEPREPEGKMVVLDKTKEKRKSVEKQKLQDKEKWMGTLTKREIKVGKSARYLRIATGLTQEDFAGKAKIDSPNYNQIEKGVLTPRFSTLRQIFKALELQPDDQLAQLLYIKTYRNGPMTLDDVRGVVPGDLVKYLRVCLGLTTPELAKNAGVGKRTVLTLESGERTMRAHHIPAIATGLGLSEGDPLLSIFYSIVDNKTPKDDDIRSLNQGRFLFYGTEERMTWGQTFSHPDRKRLRNIKNRKRKTVGKKIAQLRGGENFTQAQLAEKAGISLHFLGMVERGARVTDVTLLAILNQMRINIHNPIAWYLLDLIDNEH